MAFSIKDFTDIKKIGNGGMGNVYLATQIALDRKVVIKELPANMLKDPKSIKRFENEAKSAAGLDHDNIIRVFDFGEDKQSFFISMEYIDGLDLELLMQHQSFPREIGLMILLQAMKGLNYAHKKGIVHCDIKPGNILISKTGKVKVVDFGLARANARVADFNDPSSVFITPGYMPPEVAAGNRVPDVFMDIWSAGVLAYRIISGVLPFAFEDMRTLVYSIVHHKQRDILGLVPTLPVALAAAVEACLEKIPSKRPPSLDGVIEALEDYLYDLGVRDIEKMIVNYIQDKDSSAREVAGFLAKYHLQRGNELLDDGNTALAEAHFREAEKNGAAETAARPQGRHAGSVLQKPLQLFAPGIGAPHAGFLSLVFSHARLGRVLSVAGVITILMLAAVMAYLLAQRKQTGHPAVATQSQSATVKNQHDGAVAKAASEPVDSGGEQIPGMAALGQQLTSVDKYKGKSKALYQKRSSVEQPHASSGTGHKAPPQAAEQKYGTVKLSIDPVGANVSIDGENVGIDRAGEGKHLKPGRHLITVQAEGYSAFKTTVTVEPNASQFIAIALKPMSTGTGLLHVHSYPWAELYVDNVYLGTTPTPTPVALSSGEHSLMLKRDGYKQFTGTVHIDRGEITRIKVQLEQ